jgi:hypothetical protein
MTPGIRSRVVHPFSRARSSRHRASDRSVAGVLRARSLAAAIVAVALAARDARAQLPTTFRRMDGQGGNSAHVDWGRAGIELLRLETVAYTDGVSMPSGLMRRSPRAISNLVVAQTGSIPNSHHVSDYVWQWGQFIDHDLDLTSTALPDEPLPIVVPAGDPFFDPLGTGTQMIGFSRSHYVMSGMPLVRQQVNEITSFIDGSMVYGSDLARAHELRTLDGTGRLKTSAGNLLPFNVNGFPNAPTPNDPTLFLAGDVRANEQVGLTAMQTLFMREHNYWARRIASVSPGASDEEIYKCARALVGAEIQHINYDEFLPVLLGPSAISTYSGFQPDVNPGVDTLFSTACYRFGHSMLSPTLLRLDSNLQTIPAGNLPLANTFFNPNEIIANGGIDPLLRGLAHQVAQEIDTMLVDGVRNFLFGPPGAGGFDLASLNIQRGRDHGLPSYNRARFDYGLAVKHSFAEVSSDPLVQARLATAYASVDDVDVWVGGLAEDHVPGALVGELVFTVLKTQFQRARDGDAFWYETYLSPSMVSLVQRQRLSDIIRRNTSIGAEIPDNVFIAP